MPFNWPNPPRKPPKHEDNPPLPMSEDGVKCSFKQDCTSYPEKCGGCRSNKNTKRDYFIPNAVTRPPE
jgi:hypothetical protein